MRYFANSLPHHQLMYASRANCNSNPAIRRFVQKTCYRTQLGTLFNGIKKLIQSDDKIGYQIAKIVMSYISHR